jgi:hypothetical protein
MSMKADKPTLIAYTVKEGHGPEAKAIWPAGAAWSHGKGGGYSNRLEALPVDGRLVLVAPLIEAQATAQG